MERTWHYALDELDRVAAELALLLQPHAVVALSGELGAGKTTLVQALCRAWGVAARVSSPTYTLEHIYASPRGPVHHIDAYRLAGPEAALAIGLDETLASGERCLVEWPERLGALLPPDAAWLRLSAAGGPDRRRLEAQLPPGAAPGPAPGQ